LQRGNVLLLGRLNIPQCSDNRIRYWIGSFLVRKQFGQTAHIRQGEIECETYRHSRMDSACARQTAIQPTGERVHEGRRAATPTAAQPSNAARGDHGVAASADRASLTCRRG
jgi:hypothetical protein